MNCPACGSDRLSATTCLVCGALLNAHPPSAASRPADVQHSRLISDSRMPARSQAPPRVDVMTRSNPIRGVARAVHLRTEPSSLKGPTWQILDFRLDRFSEDGRPLPSVPVEMRRLHLTGSVSEGETVEVRGKWQTGQLLKLTRLKNISTGSPVIAKGKPHRVLKVLAAIVFLALIALTIRYLTYHASNSQGLGSSHAQTRLLPGGLTLMPGLAGDSPGPGAI